MGAALSPESTVAPASQSDIEWLTNTTNAMLRCRSVAALLDLAYDAIRSGLGFDRVGLMLIDRAHHSLVEHIGTDERGARLYPKERVYPLTGATYLPTLLHDPRLCPDGPGFILQQDVQVEVPPDAQVHLDGSPSEVLRVALRPSDAATGMISVDNLIGKRPITMAQIMALVAFANILAVAVENVGLLEERAQRIDTLHADVRRREANLTWLQEIGGRVNSATTLEEVLDTVYDGIRDGLGYDRVGIVLLDWQRETFVEVRGTDEHGIKTCPRDRVIPLTPGSTIWASPDLIALRAGEEFYYTDDVYRDTPPDQRYLLDGHPTHNLAVALRSGEIMTGMISVDNFTSGRPIEREQATPLLALANQVGTAIERARVLESERAERVRLQVLLESARALNSTLDSDHILEVLASSLTSALGASAAHFSHVDRHHHTLRSIDGGDASARVDTGSHRKRDVLSDYTLIERVLDSRRPYVGELDGAQRETVHGEDRQADHTVLLVPLVVQDAAIGVLEVYWDHSVPISAETIDLCAAIADQASLAIHNARLYAEATRQAECDPLTGLLNHRTLLEYLDSRLLLPVPFTLLLIDVNDFKLFNDTHGHLVGDAVLIQVAGILREVCREHDRAARYGGDEFAVVLLGAGRSEAEAVAQRLHHAVHSRPFTSRDDHCIPLSISIGMACYHEDGRTCQELVAVADADMYSAKHRATEGANGSPALLSLGGFARVQRGAADLLGDSPFGVLEGLVDAVDAKDRYTREHSDDVTHLALLLATELELDEEQRRRLVLAGALHDVGKIAVPDRILRKPGRLTTEEYEAVKRHVTYGIALIRGVLEDTEVVEAVAHHHERWDGRGYPTGLPGIHTPLLGRIMQLADAASAMHLDRPYRRGLPRRSVVAQLRAGAGTQFDPALVEPFVRVVSGYIEDDLPA
jgi:diguanylate cyclase (GGDEF)-like protein/putative nucleotidyltransferase with HDIG domain